MDNRDVFGINPSPNNDILIVCDHATNDLKFIKPLDSEETAIRSNQAFDPGAADIACELSERLKCMSVFTNFSKLIIDPSVGICS
jgi:predicted N-formylglutamate amidohydrolase